MRSAAVRPAGVSMVSRSCHTHRWALSACRPDRMALAGTGARLSWTAARQVDSQLGYESRPAISSIKTFIVHRALSIAIVCEVSLDDDDYDDDGDADDDGAAVAELQSNGVGIAVQLQLQRRLCLCLWRRPVGLQPAR